MNQLYNKIKANQQLLNLSKNLISEEHLVKIYYAQIYSHIQHGIITWGSMAKKSMIDDIYTAQKACTRQKCRKPKNYNTNELFKKLKILKMPDIIELELSKFG